MSKAILILDEMPESCNECPLKVLDADLYYTTYACKNVNCETDDILKTTKYEMYCPLKPMPEKKHNNGGYRVIDGTEWFYDSEHDDGWNDCIDVILGDKDE